MEYLSPDHLHADGCAGRAAGSSLQQLEHQPHQVQDETSTQEAQPLPVSFFLSISLQTA